MSMGLVGTKIGMTRVFEDSGVSIPVTVLQVTPNRVTQLKKTETDGYFAVQLTYGEKKQSRVNKPQAGHFAKAQTEAGRGLIEFRLNEEELGQYELGQAVAVDQVFKEGQKVDVRGTTKGKGFAGGIKRHNFTAQDNTHGNSVSHRHIGSTGQNQTPGRVFKGKKMPGQLGNVKRTLQNLTVVRVDAERNLILVKGSLPGAPKSDVIITPAVKS